MEIPSPVGPDTPDFPGGSGVPDFSPPDQPEPAAPNVPTPDPRGPEVPDPPPEPEPAPFPTEEPAEI